MMDYSDRDEPTLPGISISYDTSYDPWNAKIELTVLSIPYIEDILPEKNFKFCNDSYWLLPISERMAINNAILQYMILFSIQIPDEIRYTLCTPELYDELVTSLILDRRLPYDHEQEVLVDKEMLFSYTTMLKGIINKVCDTYFKIGINVTDTVSLEYINRLSNYYSICNVECDLCGMDVNSLKDSSVKIMVKGVSRVKC